MGNQNQGGTDAMVYNAFMTSSMLPGGQEEDRRRNGCPMAHPNINHIYMYIALLFYDFTIGSFEGGEVARGLPSTP